MRAFVARHAKTVVEGVCYGQHEVDVVGTYADAAEEIVRALRVLGARPNEVYASPWSRSRRLAGAVAVRVGAPTVRVDSRLSELSFGEWEGRRWDELEREDGERLAAWMASYAVARPPGGETIEELDARVLAFVSELRARGADAVVVGHAGPIRALRRLARGTTWEEEIASPVPFLSVEELTFERWFPKGN